MTHTPGPWKLTGNEIIAPEAERWAGTQPVVVVGLYGSMGGKDNEADARLIAAAPDMLAALKNMLSGYVGDCKRIGFTEEEIYQTPEIAAARAAILAATGEQP